MKMKWVVYTTHYGPTGEIDDEPEIARFSNKAEAYEYVRMRDDAYDRAPILAKGQPNAKVREDTEWDNIETPEDLAKIIGDFHHDLLSRVDNLSWSLQAKQYCMLSLQAMSSAKVFAQLAELKQAEALASGR